MTQSASPIVFFTDLDQTLFQSHASDPRGVLPMAVNVRGEDHGFARPDQKALFDQMIGSGVVIPVTARSHEQLERVTGFITGSAYDLALTDLGASLLVRDNNGDGLWHAISAWTESYLPFVHPHIHRLTKDYEIIEAWVRNSELNGQVQIDLIQLGKLHLPLYMVLTIKGEEGSKAEDLAAVRHRFVEPIARATGKYQIHETEGQICLWPTFVSKGIAVERLKSALRDGLGDERFDRARDYLNLDSCVSMGVGDSTTDLEFMQHTDFMVVPKTSQISNILNAEVSRMLDKEPQQ